MVTMEDDEGANKAEVWREGGEVKGEIAEFVEAEDSWAEVGMVVAMMVETREEEDLVAWG